MNQESVVGAPGFEPGTSCAQGSCKKSISLVRPALFCAMVPGCRRGPNDSQFSLGEFTNWNLSADRRGAHRFEFVGKEPLALWVVVSLLFANTVVMRLPESAGKYILAQHAPGFPHWYADHSVAIQFVLLAALGAIFFIYRKPVRDIRRK